MFQRNARQTHVTLGSPFLATGLARRLVWLGCLGLLACHLVPGDVTAQDTKTKAALDLPSPQPITLLTRDGVPLKITYYASNQGKETSVVVLLHMKDRNRFVWQNGFAEQLQAEGYAVITVDLRGHGESKIGAAAILPTGNVNQDGDDKKGDKRVPRKAGRPVDKPIDYKLMAVEDMETVKKFIFEEHQAERLNMAKLALVGPEMGASVAAYFAMLDWEKKPHPDGRPGFQTPRGQDVRALVLISPESNFPGLPIAVPTRFLREPVLNVAFMIAVGKKDTLDKTQAKKLYGQLTSYPKNEERMYLQEYDSKERGTDLLGKQNVRIEGHMLAFLDRHLRSLQIPWRDRRSKLDQ